MHGDPTRKALILRMLTRRKFKYNTICHAAFRGNIASVSKSVMNIKISLLQWKKKNRKILLQGMWDAFQCIFFWMSVSKRILYGERYVFFFFLLYSLIFGGMSSVFRCWYIGKWLFHTFTLLVFYTGSRGLSASQFSRISVAIADNFHFLVFAENTTRYAVYVRIHTK